MQAFVKGHYAASEASSYGDEVAQTVWNCVCANGMGLSGLCRNVQIF